jgi:hypothetical protein
LSSVSLDATRSANCGGTDATAAASEHIDFASSLDQVTRESNQLVQLGGDILNSVMDDEETAHNKKQNISYS